MLRWVLVSRLLQTVLGFRFSFVQEPSRALGRTKPDFLQVIQQSQVDAQRDLTNAALQLHRKLSGDEKALSFKCHKVGVIGGKGAQPDGAWRLCKDKVAWQFLSRPCTVFSFGIGDDWSFEDSMANAQYFLPSVPLGCKVHAFDPTISDPRKEQLSACCRKGNDDCCKTEKDQHGQQSQNIWFHQVGLSGEDSENMAGVSMLTGAAQWWQVRTLHSHMQQIGTSDLDVLKIDVEGHEWAALRSALDSGALLNVTQLLVEVHFWDPSWSADTHVRAMRDW
jgi:FkbM family methyltransferase